MRLLLLILLMTLTLVSSDKVALVIGNKNYSNQTGLNNPINDTELIRDTLKGMGYEVLEAYNLRLKKLDDKLDEFIGKAQRAKIAIIYYAGHGMGVNGKNYLIPIGTSHLSLSRLDKRLTSVNELKEAVSYASDFGVVMFDACRNSFFKEKIRGLSSRGGRALVLPTVSRANVLVSFSTSPNTIANDDVHNGKHSPYALALSEKLKEKKNVDIRQVMGSIRDKVYALTSYKRYPQETVEENKLGGEQYCLSGRCQQQEVQVVERIVYRYRDRPNPVSYTHREVIEPRIYSTKEIITIDGLMYQNQFITKEDDKNYYADKTKGRVQTWQGAKEYCQSLTLGGYRKWRLPNRVELRKLITKTTHNTASGDDMYMRADFAKNLQKGSVFWTSESKDSSLAWAVLFSFGYDGWYGKTVQGYALCVR